MHVYTEFWHFISPRFRLCVFVCPRITRGEMVCKDLSKLEQSVPFEDQEKNAAVFPRDREQRAIP